MRCLHTRKPPTHVYIIECWRLTKHGAITACYAGITNDPRRRVQEHLDGRGARFMRGKVLRRMVALEYRPDVCGEFTIYALEKKVKAFTAAAKLAIVKAAFAEISTFDATLEGTWIFGAFWLWERFWQQCSKQCQKMFTKIRGRRVQIGTFSMGEGGGYGCKECGGSGGVFVGDDAKADAGICPTCGQDLTFGCECDDADEEDLHDDYPRPEEGDPKWISPADDLDTGHEEEFP